MCKTPGWGTVVGAHLCIYTADPTARQTSCANFLLTNAYVAYPYLLPDYKKYQGEITFMKKFNKYNCLASYIRHERQEMDYCFVRFLGNCEIPVPFPGINSYRQAAKHSTEKEKNYRYIFADFKMHDLVFHWTTVKLNEKKPLVGKFGAKTGFTEGFISSINHELCVFEITGIEGS